MKTAIIYARISTSRQDYERQIKELKQEVINRNYELLDVFNDDQSGLIKGVDRPEFKRLMEFIKVNKVDCLFVWEISRLGRRLSDAFTNLDYFCDNNINIYVKNDNSYVLDYSTMQKTQYGNLTLGIVASIAQASRNELIYKLKSGKKYKASNAGNINNVQAYGYTSKDKKVVIDEEQAEVIKKIFQLYIDGNGCYKIAKILNLNNVNTKFQTVYSDRETFNKKEVSSFIWQASTVNKILKNSIYIGKKKYGIWEIKNKKRVRKGYEIFDLPELRIISDEIFDKAQQIMQSEANKRGNNTKLTNYLQSKIVCGICKKNYIQIINLNKNIKTFTCSSKRLINKKCDSSAISIDRLYSIIYIINKEDIQVNIKKKNRVEEIEVDIEKVSTEIKILKTQLNDKESETERLTKTFIKGNIKESMYDSEYKALNDSIIKLKDNISFQINRLNELKTVLDSVNNIDFKVDYKSSLELYDKLITDITVYPVSNVEDFSKFHNRKTDTLLYLQIKTIYREYNIIYFRHTKRFIVVKDKFEFNTTTNEFIYKDENTKLVFDYEFINELVNYHLHLIRPNEKMKISKKQLEALPKFKELK